MTRVIALLALFLHLQGWAGTSPNPLEGLSQITNLNQDHYFAEHKYILAYVDDMSKGCKKCAKAREIMMDVVPKVPQRFEIKLAFINKKTDSALLKKLKIFESRVFVYLANNRAVPFRENTWTSKAVARWLKTRIIKPSQPFEYETEFENLEKNHPRLVTYAGKRNKYYNIFRYVASSYEDINFIHSFSPPVLDRRNRTVDFTKNPEKTSFTITVPFTATQLNELIETHNNVQRILDATTLARMMTKEDLSFLLVHTDPSHPDVTNFFRTGIKHYKQALFVSTPLVEAKFMKKIVRWLGIGPNHGKPYPQLRLLARESGKMKRYEFKGKVTEQSILKFLEDYKSGMLKSYYLSEDIPSKQTGIVQRVVGTNFESVVGNKLKDTIVFFHSVWCLECKDILVTFESLAGRFAGFSDIQFLTCDSYNNEGVRIPDGADGEPVLRLYKAEDKKHPVNYKGKWLLSDLQKWLEGNLNIQVDL